MLLNAFAIIHFQEKQCFEKLITKGNFPTEAI